MSHGPNLASQICFLWIKFHGNIVCLFIYMLSRTASVLQQRAWVTETEPGPQSLKYLLASPYPGEGNSSPLQCSCLENPRDGGLPPVGSHRVGHDWSDLAAAAVIPGIRSVCKESACQCRIQVWPLTWEDPLDKKMAAHSSILSWKSHGQRSLMGCSPWGRIESDTAEHTHHTSPYENKCANPWCMSAVPLRSPGCCRQLCMWCGEKEPHWYCDFLIAKKP